jgi:hypothetical protein
LERIPFFFFLLPIFLFLHIENEYRHLINYRFVYFEIIQLVIAALMVFLVSLLFFRELAKASIFGFGFLLVFYYFCDLKDYLHFNKPGFFSSYSFLLPLLFLLLFFFFIIIRKSKSRFRQLFLYLNSLFFILIAWECITFLVSPRENKTDLGDLHKKFSRDYQPCSNCNKPDIYYLLFDGYTSSDVLKSEFGFENPLDHFLSLRGFYVTPNSKSNYNLTPFSIGSVFNLDYLPGLKSDQPFFIKDYLPGVATVYQSELFPVLAKEGYKVANHSIFNLNGFPSSIPPYDLWEIHQVYARHNIFWKADTDIGWLIRRKLNLGGRSFSQRAYIDAKDRHLMRTIENTMKTIRTPESQPKFVYSHFVLPHGPYSFDSVGNRYQTKSIPLTWEEYRSGYIAQVKYTNLVIAGMVDSIIQRKKRPTVIIIQGDHGFRFNQPEKQLLQFDNFNAFYFSNEKYFQVKDSVSNVNTFRFVFNAFFDKKLPLLRDTSIFLHYR